ncbi:hypothetical protein [Actinoplanes sp. NBRC 103695]|uniref:hypothetical protein n=1 Tax=Actinoplanes sp. NBRC 103695 TaxID=3032202 RepID=UPI0024A5908B|nr:hypothetical protein [Actinoplanes sp. NBRC 103695]GLY92912.1 hypothetical protein Acsp02_01680 [Actinoplanes sp. NBRC 103695]
MSRLLLAAYPARMRRRHGPELVSTLADVTGGHPSSADHLRLAIDGLRERFRLPAVRPIGVVTAVLAMVVGGALGLLGGSWAGEQAHSPVPAVGPLMPQILGPDARPTQTTHERFALSITSPIGAAGLEPSVREIHTRLTAAGWDVTAIKQDRGQPGFSARTGDLRVSVQGYTDLTVSVMGYPVRPAAYLPLLLGGLAIGLLAGWLIGAALAHRLAASPHRFPALVTGALGAALLLVPAGRLYQGLYLYLSDDDGNGVGKLAHDALAWMPWPLRDTSAFPDTLGPGLRTLAIGLAVIGLAAVFARPPHQVRGEAVTP